MNFYLKDYAIKTCIYDILHITFGYPCTVTAAPSQLTDPFSKIKKIEKKNPPEFRDIAPNKGINKKKCLEIAHHCV